MTERHNGEIWISGGLLVTLHIDNNRLTVQTPSIPIPTSLTDYILEDRTGNIWVTRGENGIYRIGPNNQIHHYLEQEKGTPVTDLAEDSQGNIYAACMGKGLYQYNTADDSFQLIPYQGKNNLSIKALFIGKQDEVYICTDGQGVKIYQQGSNTVTDYQFENSFYNLSDSKVHSLLKDNNDNFWMALYQKGVMFLPSQPNGFKYIGSKSSNRNLIGKNCVTALCQDTQNSFWIGTDNGGLYRLSADATRSIHYPTLDKGGTAPATILNLYEDSEGTLWFGSFINGMGQINKQNGVCSYEQNLKDKGGNHIQRVYAFAEDHKKRLWIATMGAGLFYRDLKNGQTFYPEIINTKINSWISCMLYTPDHLLYIGTYDGLSCIDLNNEEMIHTESILNGHIINAVCQDTTGMIWIGTADGLSSWNRINGEVKTYTAKQGLPSNTVYALITDNDGYLWISTNAGIARFHLQNHHFINYYVSDGLQGNEFAKNTSYKDPEGNIWLGTDNGLFRMDIKTNRLQQFNKADGAQGQTYYPFSTFKSTNGELYFGGNEGFSIISPSKISYNNYKPTVILSDFLLDNIPVIPNTKNSPLKSSIFQTKELVLDYNQNNFSFEFTSTNYLNPGKNRFRYRLEKYDDKWIETDASHRSVSYSKVPKGTYNFEIMTANNDGVWGELTSLKIIIKPAPWLSNWAIVAYILLVLLILYALIRYYNYQRKLKMYYYLEEREREQKEEYHQAQLTFFTNVSHDFRTPLSLILAALEPIKAGNLAGKYISILENNAKRLLALVNEVMDFRSLQNNKIKLNIQIGNWNQFVSDNCSDFSESAEQKRIRYTVEQDPSIAANYYFDKKIMEKILLNLLNNAFKYTPEGGYIKVETLSDIRNFTSTHANKIIIQSGNETRNLFGLVISDSGVGISEASIRHIFERYYRVSESSGTQHLGSGIGLALVKSLVELHKGYIAVYSERDLGSDIVIGFPDDASVYEANDFHNNNKADPHNPESKLDNNSKFMDHEISPITPPLPDSKKKNILFAEDNNDLRELLSETLREYYNVEEVANGQEALELLANKNIDLVLTDIMMPGINGIELSKKIKENIDSSHIPVVILTAKTGDENQIEGLYSGADIYLKKPVNKQILLLSLSNLFKQQARIREYYAKHYFAQTNDTETSINKRDAEFMKQLTEVIEKNLSNADIDVLQIASTLAMSRRTLYSKVKALTGQSVVEFIRNYRLRKAAQILAEEDISISMVMDRVGIDNASYFSRIFKKEFGESPSEFVFRHHKKSDEE